MEDPAVFNAYKEMTVPAQPDCVEEHVRRLEESLQANGFAPNRNGGRQGYLHKVA